MIIAVNTKIPGKGSMARNENFIVETFSRIISLHTQHTFILIGEKKPSESFGASQNIIHEVIGLQGVGSAKWYLLFNIKINAILKKHKADFFISYGFGSPGTKVPQCIIDPDLSCIHFPGLFKRTHLLFYKSFISRSIKKSKSLVVFSQYCKAEIIKHFKKERDKIEVVTCGVNENFHKISNEEREIVKTKYSGDNEYFVYTGATVPHENLINLLKSFSAFKKRQKSAMQLIIAGKPGFKYEALIESMQSFKFRQDVKIYEDRSNEQLAQLTGASYALIYIADSECFPMQPLQAMKSCVPVIASSGGARSEILGDSVLYADSDNFKEIAVKMMMLYRDEKLRNQLIKKGEKQASFYNWEITASQLWKNVEEYLV